MIKVYVVTYNNAVDINVNITSLLSSDLMNHEHEINIINNHSELAINLGWGFKVNVLNNDLRPDFSTGHLSRNWNQALINGFESLQEPKADIVVHSQDDVVFEPNWVAKLKELHERYSFVTAGVGDAMCSYTVDAVRKIGLWDERFCNIGYHEADYFLRALIYNKDKSSINDLAHGRELNPVDGNFFYGTFDPRGHGGNKHLLTVPPRNEIRHENHLKSANNYHRISQYVYETKWVGVRERDWTQDFIDNPPKISNCLNYIYYPYFEKDIEGLKSKNYAVKE